MREQRTSPDLPLFLAVAALLTLGVVMVYSASQYMAADSAIDDGLYYLKRQCLWAAIGLTILFILLKIDPKKLEKWALPSLIFAVLCLVAVKIAFGASALGAERSIALGPFHFQPSEAAKLSLVLFFASWYGKNLKNNETLLKGFLLPLGICGVIVALIMLQPDLGTTATILATAFLLMCAAGVKFRYLLFMVFSGCALVVTAIVLEPFRMARFTAFLDPWADPQGYGFQTVQSLIAIGSGGITGVGLGNGGAKWYYLPEVHTDFIFALIGEELGLIGTVFTVLLFAVIIWRGLRIALFCDDLFLSLLAFGLTALLGTQTLINFFVASGMMPVTGIALPFISYGGSSLLFSLADIGILLSISTTIPKGDLK